MKRTFIKILAIFWKDILTEFRTKEVVTSVLVFALLVMVIFNFAFSTSADVMELVAPGILWVALTILYDFYSKQKINFLLELSQDTARLFLNSIEYDDYDTAIISVDKLLDYFISIYENIKLFSYFPTKKKFTLEFFSVWDIKIIVAFVIGLGAGIAITALISLKKKS